ncbi:hypothetical protein OIE75_20450 [Streptomyces sp. NBC_01723]|uniref:hypothetical protein n=1 Tax=Streptomyces sp. NBC_01723 TaxID=2975921 RepID=UPI002E315D56|nr:hypothetical protein [Streptomyces sp. NBC_01723]
MRQEDESGEGGDAGHLLIGIFFWTRNVAAAGTALCALYALFGGGGWLPALIGLAATAACEGGCWAPVLYAWIGLLRAKRQTLRSEARVRQLELLRAQNELILAQKAAQIEFIRAQNAALRAEKVELERLLLQRRLEQEARDVRQRLDIAVASVEADLLEAAAWRMDMTAKQLEVKLTQADYLSKLADVEEDAQERILRAYEKGVEHGERGIVVPAKSFRHLRVVEESA